MTRSGGSDAPVVFFHGGNSFNADALAWFPDVVDQFRIYAADIIGHPGRSAETRLSPADLSSGEWADDVMTSLGLDHASGLGVSYGAGIVMRLAVVAPQQLDKVALVVPSGLVKPKMMSMMGMVLPWMHHAVSPSRQNVVRMLQPLFADNVVDDETVDTFTVMFDNVRIERGLPRPAGAHELANLVAPARAIAAELDPLFPGSSIIPRAQEIIPNLFAAEAIPGSGHCPSPEDRRSISERVAKFPH